MALALKCECHWHNYLAFLPIKLRQKLMPFQREGIKYAIDKSGRCLLADEMGLGKTLQAICIAYYYKSEWPLLIVVPSSMKFIWIEEIEKWLPEVMPHDINLLLNTSDLSDIPHALITIVTYGLVRSSHAHVLIEALFNQNFKVVVVDESHYIKNTKTASCRVLMPLVQQAERRILITGTPALSRPVELYGQLDAILPGQFGTFNTFTKRYCDGHLEWIGRIRKWRTDGASNLDELQYRLSNTLMIRRLKKDVLTQLPPKRRQRIPFELKESKFKKDLDRAWDDLSPVMKNLRMNVVDFLKVDGDGGAQHGNNISEMRGLIFELYRKTCKAKIGPVVEYVKFLLEDPTSKFLVFAHHHEMMDAIQKELILSKVEYIRIDGNTAQSDRARLVHAFQTKNTIRVAILSILAAGVGLTFTAASLVVFAELHWTPGTLVQCEDRAHRIGQTNPVNIHYLVARGSVDEWVWGAIKKKTVVVSTILNGVCQSMEEVINQDEDKIYRLSNADVYKPPDPGEEQELPQLFDDWEDELPSTQTQITDFFRRRAENKQDVNTSQPLLDRLRLPKPQTAKGKRNDVVVIDDDSDGDDFKDVAKKINIVSKKGSSKKEDKILERTDILDTPRPGLLEDSRVSDEGSTGNPDWLDYPEGVDCYDYDEVYDGGEIRSDDNGRISDEQETKETSFLSRSHQAGDIDKNIEKDGSMCNTGYFGKSDSFLGGQGSSAAAEDGRESRSQSDTVPRIPHESDSKDVLYEAELDSVDNRCDSKTVGDSHSKLSLTKEKVVNEKNGTAAHSLGDELAVISHEGARSESVTGAEDSLSDDSDKTPVRKVKSRKSFGLASGSAWSSVTLDEVIIEGINTGAETVDKLCRKSCNEEVALPQVVSNRPLPGEGPSKYENMMVSPEKRDVTRKVHKEDKAGGSCRNKDVSENLHAEESTQNIHGGVQEEISEIQNSDGEKAEAIRDDKVRVSETEAGSNSETDALSIGGSDQGLEGHRPGVVSETDMDVDSDDQGQEKNESGVQGTCVSDVSNASLKLEITASDIQLDNTVSSHGGDDSMGIEKTHVTSHFKSLRTPVKSSGHVLSMSVQSEPKRLPGESYRRVSSASSSDEQPPVQISNRLEKWACHICTFVNHADLPYCEMCETKRIKPVPSSMHRKREKRKVKRRSSHVVSVAKFDPNLDDSDDDFTTGIPTQTETHQKASSSQVSEYFKHSTEETDEEEGVGAVRKCSRNRPKKHSREESSIVQKSPGLNESFGPRKTEKSTDTSLRNSAKRIGLPMDFIDPSELPEAEVAGSDALFTEQDSGDDYAPLLDLGPESDKSDLSEEGEEFQIDDDGSNPEGDASVTPIVVSQKAMDKSLLNMQWPEMKETFPFLERYDTRVSKRISLSTSTTNTGLSLDPDLVNIGQQGLVSACGSNPKVPKRNFTHRSRSVEVDPDLTDMSKEEYTMQIDDSDSDCGDDAGQASAVGDAGGDADISDDDDELPELSTSVKRSSQGGSNTADVNNGAFIASDIKMHSPANTDVGDVTSTEPRIRKTDSCEDKFVARNQVVRKSPGAYNFASPKLETISGAIDVSSANSDGNDEGLLAKELKAAVELFSPKSSFRSAKKFLGDWTCNKCGHKNDVSDDDCDECFCPKLVENMSPLDDSLVGPGVGKSEKQFVGRQKVLAGWKCLECDFQNRADDTTCFVCSNQKPVIKTSSDTMLTTNQKSMEGKPSPHSTEPIVKSGASNSQNRSADVNEMFGDLDAIFCRTLDPTQATWTCLQCGHANSEEDDLCDECFLKRGEKPPQGSKLRPVEKPCKKCEERRKRDDENRVINLDDITIHETFLFCCSKNTSRVFVYDKNVTALNINFIPMDVETNNLDDIPDLLLHPAHFKLIKTFVKEWNSLSVTKKRVCLRQGMLFKSPLAFYEEVKGKKVTMSNQRYKTKVDVAVEAMAKADEVQGSLRIIERPKLTMAEAKVKFDATVKRLQEVAKAKQRAIQKTPKKRKTSQKTASAGKRKGSVGKRTPSGSGKTTGSQVTPRKEETVTAGVDDAKRNLGDFLGSDVKVVEHGALTRPILVSEEAGREKTMLQIATAKSQKVKESGRNLVTIATVSSTSKRKVVEAAAGSDRDQPSKKRKTENDSGNEAGPSLDLSRLPIDVNGKVIFSEADQGVVQAVDKDGIPLCLHCHTPVTNQSLSNTTVKSTDAAWELRLCSRQCKEQYWLKTNRQYGRHHVFELEHGVCQMCNFDADNFFQQLKAMKDYTSRASLIKDSPFSSLSADIKQRMVKDPKQGMFWHVDHITAVADGGGQCDIDNLRTLCYLCHKVVTKQQNRERAIERRVKQVGRCADLTKFFQPKME